MITLPITALFAGILTIWFVGTAMHASLTRARHNVALGHGTAEQTATLQPVLRVHANTAEYLPLFILVFALLEFHGLRPEVLYVLGGLFTTGRVLHRRALLRSSLKLRLWGMQFTLWPLLIGGAILIFTWFVQTELF